MFTFLSVICICITVIYVVKFIQKNPMTFTLHKTLEEVHEIPQARELTEEEKKYLDEQKQVLDGFNQIIQLTQEFEGGEIQDAQSEHEAE